MSWEKENFMTAILILDNENKQFKWAYNVNTIEL